MPESAKDMAQDSSFDNTGVDPNLSGIDAIDGSAPDTTSGAPSTEELIAEAEEIVAEAAAAVDAEVVEAQVIEDAPAEDEAADEAPAMDVDAVMAQAAEQLAAAKAEATEWQNRYMRLHAEWDTYRRRTAEERKEERARATEKLVEELLPVLDDFERTVSHAQSHGEAGLLGGVEAVQKKLLAALAKAGLQTIDPAGEPFNALEAQAVAMVDDPVAFDETVAQVYMKGYKMGGHVLRSAMVTVTTGGPKREAPAEEE